MSRRVTTAACGTNMEVTLSRIFKDWFDEHEFNRHFITEYPGRDSLIVRHPVSCKMIIFIFQRDIILAYFDTPIHLNVSDPQLFRKLDKALRRFVERI